MFNVIDSGFPESLSGMVKVWFFGFKRFAIGGERMSLYSLENDVIRTLGDERVHFALNCMSVGCPRLPRVPFRADQLNRQLDEAARQFFAESRNLQVIPEQKLMRVSSILKFYRADFLLKSPTLISYINKYASTRIPEDHQIEFAEYDWTVNESRRRRPRNAGRMCGAIDGNRSAVCRDTMPTAIADYRDVGPRRGGEPR